MRILRRKIDNIVVALFPNDASLMFTKRGFSEKGSPLMIGIVENAYEIVVAPEPAVFEKGSMSYSDENGWVFEMVTPGLKAKLLKIVEDKTETIIEGSSIVVAGLSAPVPTSERAQTRISNARSNMERRSTSTPVVFAGLGSITKTKMAEMEDAVFDFVTSVHARHAALYDEILAASDLNNIDISAGWPAG